MARYSVAGLLLVAMATTALAAKVQMSREQIRAMRMQQMPTGVSRVDCSVEDCLGTGFVEDDRSPKHVLEALIDFDSFELLPGWTFNGQDGESYINPDTNNANFIGIGVAHLDEVQHRYASEAPNGAVVLTTGDAIYSVFNHNSNNYTSYVSQGVENPLLSSYCSADGTGDVTADCAVFEFKVRAKASDFLYFKLGFASDEYREYIDYFPTFNDVVGLSVNGVEQAVVPGTDLRVSIANINPLTNAEYYEEAGDGIEYWGRTNQFLQSAEATKFELGGEYNVFMGICDCYDASVDSAMYLPLKSFKLCNRVPNVKCPADETFVCAHAPSVAVAKSCEAESAVVRADSFGEILMPRDTPYEIIYEASDPDFGSASCSYQVSVTASAPVATILDAGLANDVVCGNAASFQISVSDQCGLAKYILDFGDGYSEEVLAADAVDALLVSHVYAAAGSYQVILRAINIYDMESMDSIVVSVSCPTASPTPTASPSSSPSAVPSPKPSTSKSPSPRPIMTPIPTPSKSRSPSPTATKKPCNHNSGSDSGRSGSDSGRSGSDSDSDGHHTGGSGSDSDREGRPSTTKKPCNSSKPRGGSSSDSDGHHGGGSGSDSDREGRPSATKKPCDPSKPRGGSGSDSDGHHTGRSGSDSDREGRYARKTASPSPIKRTPSPSPKPKYNNRK